jgi:hypothetical protein|tara:strand:+ start:1067 stop:1312 length:246 start_codon:yes stop_codon:yes gene_type:complete
MVTIKEKKLLFKEMKSVIAKYLQECDSSITPYVCEMQSTQKGYNEIEQFVLNLMVIENYTIGRAIMIKERQLDPTLLNDTF